jgi:uncharacterized protein YqkB
MTNCAWLCANRKSVLQSSSNQHYFKNRIQFRCLIVTTLIMMDDNIDSDYIDFFIQKLDKQFYTSGLMGDINSNFSQHCGTLKSLVNLIHTICLF